MLKVLNDWKQIIHYYYETAQPKKGVDKGAGTRCYVNFYGKGLVGFNGPNINITDLFFKQSFEDQVMDIIREFGRMFLNYDADHDGDETIWDVDKWQEVIKFLDKLHDG